jgi:putative ABC transport system permease protein
MNPGVPVAYLQLTKTPRRLAIAIAGVVISALGILCQMGFEDSLFRSATRLFDELDTDLVVISPQYQFMVLPLWDRLFGTHYRSQRPTRP